MLVNQFVAGLLPEIKSKLVGIEGSFSQLLVKARCEEAKLQHFDSTRSEVSRSQTKAYLPGNSRSVVNPENDVSFRPQRSGIRFKTGPRCYNCGSLSHLIRQCPYSTKQKCTEATGNKLTNSNNTKDVIRETNVVSNVTTVENVVDNNQSEVATSDQPSESSIAEVNKALDSVVVQMHGITSEPSTGNVQLGPVLKALVEVEGELVEALLDTGSPVTIIQLEALLEILAKQRRPGQTPSEWRTVVESRLEPTSLILQNYSGDNLKIVRQIKIDMSRPGYSIIAVVQVQKGAPAKLLIGIDLLSQLGYFFIQTTEDNSDCDLLSTDSNNGDNSLGGINVLREDQSDEEGPGGDCIVESDVKNPSVNTVDEKGEMSVVDKPSGPSVARGNVCLVQATRIPARDKKNNES